MRKIKIGAIAVALALSTALPVEIPYTAGLIGTPAAEAGVLSSIKGAAKKVESAAKKVGGGVKTVGKEIVRTSKAPLTPKGWRAIGGAVKTGVRATGRTVKTVATKVGHGVKVGAQKTWSGIKRVANAIPRAKFNPGGRPIKVTPRPPTAPGNPDGKPPVAKAQSFTGRDKSAWGRPAGVAKPSIRSMRQSTARVHRR